MANNSQTTCSECGGKLIQEYEGDWQIKDPDLVETNYICNNCGVQVQIEETVNELRIARDDIPGISSRSVSVTNPDRVQKDFLGKKTKPLTVTKIRGLETGTGEERRIAEQYDKIDRLLQQDLFVTIDPETGMEIEKIRNVTRPVIEDIKRLSLNAIKNKKHLRTKILLGACLYEALKIHHTPVTFGEIAKYLAKTENSVNPKEMEKSISSLYSKLRTESEFGKAIISEHMPINPIECLTGPILRESKVSEYSINHVYGKAREIFQKLEGNSFFEGKNPLGIAAALVFTSMKELRIKPVGAQRKVAAAFGVSDLTVRTNSAMIDTILERNSA